MEKFFYLNSNNEQAGPISPMDFSRYGINENTMIWKKGMPNWVKAGQLPELSQYFRLTVPTPPSPTINKESDYVGQCYNQGNSNSGAYNGGNYPPGQFKPSKPDNNMVLAVVCTLCCCLPFGIYAVIQSSKVNGLYDSGCYDEAQRMADEAKKWALIGVAIGVITNILGFIIGFVTA